MAIRKPKRRHSLKDLAQRPKDVYGWEWRYAEKEEQEYVKSLSPKDLLDYLDQREQEAFLDHI